MSEPIYTGDPDELVCIGLQRKQWRDVIHAVEFCDSEGQGRAGGEAFIREAELHECSSGCTKTNEES